MVKNFIILKLHYLNIKKLSALLRGITSNNAGDFYCLICFHSYSKENKLKKHKSVCKHHNCCYVEMPKKGNKILKKTWRKIYDGFIYYLCWRRIFTWIDKYGL